MATDEVVIYHNPNCGTSRKVLGMLRDAGVTEDMFASLSDKAMQSHWVRTNPRPINAPRQVEEMLRSAW